MYEDLQVHLKRRVTTRNFSTTTLLLQHKEVHRDIQLEQLCTMHHTVVILLHRKWFQEK
jgi:hypothetical protein